MARPTSFGSSLFKILSSRNLFIIFMINSFLIQNKWLGSELLGKKTKQGDIETRG